jgi:hypothetical protein
MNINYDKKAFRPQRYIYIAAVCDYIGREVIKKERFATKAEALNWAEFELSGWKEKGDRIVTEERDGWTDVMVETATGCIDFYVEIHKRNRRA